MVLYHVTPIRNIEGIRELGLLPFVPSGLDEHYDEPMVFLFSDKATAEDALEWLMELYEDDQYFALLSVKIPKGVPVYKDPRFLVVGSSSCAYMTPVAIPPRLVRLVDIIDVGPPEDV